MSKTPRESKKFTKNDAFKSRLDLLPPDAIEWVGHALGHGARFYAPNNWRKCKDPARYVAASLRHILKHMKGQFLDRDSGLPHLACGAVNLLFALDLNLTRGHDSYTMGNYFALIEKRSKKRGVIKRRFKGFEPAWKYLEENQLDPSKYVIKTVIAAEKVGQCVRV